MPRLVLITALLLPTTAMAGNVRATLDRSQVSVDDELTLTLTVVGDSDSPDLPASLRNDFDVAGTNEASQVSIMNGRMSSSTHYTFTLVPKHVGTLTIPAIPVTVDGAKMATEPLQVRVVAGSTVPNRGSDDLYVVAELTPASGAATSAYVGEQLLFTLRVYARVNASCPSLKLPDFAGANAFELGEQRQYKARDGVDELSVVEVRRALFATKAGTLEIPAVRLTCSVEQEARRSRNDFGSIFGPPSVRKVIRSNGSSMQILPLPPLPDSFSGLVGRVDVDAHLSRTNANNGDSVTLTLVVRGNADMTGAPEPAVSLGDAFKAYDDKPVVRQDTSGAELIGERTFEKALVAQRGGDVSIPIGGLVYFDPLRRAYATASAGPLVLHVSGGAGVRGSDNVAPAVNTVTTNGATRRNVNGDVTAPRGQAFTMRGDNAIAVMAARWLNLPRVVVLLILPLAIAFIVRYRNLHRRRDPARARRLAATREALSRLSTLDADNADEVSRIVRQLIGALTVEDGRALTTDEALVSLADNNIPSDVIARATALLTACDAAIYGGAAATSLRDDALALTRRFSEAA